MSKISNLLDDALDAAKKFIGWILPSSKHILDIVLHIVNGVKNFDDQHPDVANFITSIIPGTIDDALVAKVRGYLPELLVRLKWAELESDKTPDQIAADGAAFIKTLPSPEQAAALQLLWILISNKLTDDGVAVKDLQKISQVYYEASKAQ